MDRFSNVISVRRYATACRKPDRRDFACCSCGGADVGSLFLQSHTVVFGRPGTRNRSERRAFATKKSQTVTHSHRNASVTERAAASKAATICPGVRGMHCGFRASSEIGDAGRTRSHHGIPAGDRSRFSLHSADRTIMIILLLVSGRRMDASAARGPVALACDAASTPIMSRRG